ncbi:hypothetical protein [Alienimonas sp. DA493]|uniref:hypothetical protein n=1 Tax=Alienimonas sp. DA493 TaxID=3373605 RepID=UPI0037543395
MYVPRQDLVLPPINVWIDDLGDPGLVRLRSPDHPSGSSPWFGMSAVLVADRVERSCVDQLSFVERSLPGRRGRSVKRVHFRDLSHKSRVMLAGAVARLPVLTVSYLVNKAHISPGCRVRQKGELVRHAARGIVRLVSDVCARCRDDELLLPEGAESLYPASSADWLPPQHGPLKFVFSHTDRLPQQDLRAMFRALRDRGDSTIDWSLVDPDVIRSMPHESRVMLHAADVAASSLGALLNPDPDQFTEARYAEELSPRFYKSFGNKDDPTGLVVWPRSACLPSPLRCLHRSQAREKMSEAPVPVVRP